MFPEFDDDKLNRMETVFNSVQDLEFPEQQVEEPVQAPVRDLGPFSSLLDYEQEKKRIEESYARREQFNQKIARGNAITDGFNLLTTGLGGAFGATIPRRGPNQSVINALNDYRAMDSEKRERLDRFRMLDINARSRDLQYGLGLEAEQRGRDFARDQKAEDRGFTAGEKDKDRTFKAGQVVEAQDFAAKESAKARQGRAALRDKTTQGQKDLEQFKADSGHYSYQDRSYANKKAFNIKGVDITPDLEVQMIRALQMLYDGDANKPRVLKSVDRNENINEESVRDLFLEHWDQLAPMIPQLSGSPSRESIVATPQAGQTQQQDTAAYNQAIAETVTNTELSYRKKLKFIRDAAMEGFGFDKDKAEQYAKKMLGPK